jgi:hypothetical protein
LVPPSDVIITTQPVTGSYTVADLLQLLVNLEVASKPASEPWTVVWGEQTEQQADETPQEEQPRRALLADSTTNDAVRP